MIVVATTLASIFSTLTTLLGTKNTPLPVGVQSDSNDPPGAVPPAQNTPSKLTRFLQHAKDKLGIPNAVENEAQLLYYHYGPDIIPYVSDNAITGCGFAKGDVICLKRGAEAWWSSPEAKHKQVRVATLPQDVTHAVRFEKHFVEGGSASYFCPFMEDGYNGRSNKYEWWYYSDQMKAVIKVPPGKVPVLAAEYADVHEGEDGN